MSLLHFILTPHCYAMRKKQFFVILNLLTPRNCFVGWETPLAST